MINFLSQQTEVNDRPLDSIPSLSRLILHLVARDELGPLSMDEAYHFLNDTSISPKDYSIFAEENETHYSRNRLFLGKNMELLVLTWKPGQASRIHDHQGSVCCIKVLEGQGLEIKFTKTNCGKYIPRISETIPKHSVVSSIDDDVHLVANTEPERLVTLHLYSPPLKNMQVYGAEETILA